MQNKPLSAHRGKRLDQPGRPQCAGRGLTPTPIRGAPLTWRRQIGIGADTAAEGDTQEGTARDGCVTERVVVELVVVRNSLRALRPCRPTVTVPQSSGARRHAKNVEAR